MGKIIIITFAFMAFAFYELSGGDAFVPVAEEKRAALAVEREAEETRLAEAKAKREAESARTQVAQAPVASNQIVLASATSTETQSDDVIAAVNAALEADKAETVAPAAQNAVAEIAQAEPAATDIRKVTAARVNMRNGPGQSFNVVTKLNGGDAVEILQDPGSGWVKLKVVESGRVGWMADFLLTAANN